MEHDTRLKLDISRTTVDATSECFAIATCCVSELKLQGLVPPSSTNFWGIYRVGEHRGYLNV